MKHLVLIIPILLLLGCPNGDEGECDYNSDCASWQECAGKMCIDKPDEPDDPKAPSGTTVTSCNCSTTSAFPGQVRSDQRCASGTSVTLSCGGCCAFDNFGNCLGTSWREVCQ